MVSVESDDDGNLRVLGEATLFEAEALSQGLLDVINKSEVTEWILDLTGLSAWDSGGVQALLSFKRSVQSLRVHSCPKEFRAYLEKLGLARHLL